ncbi:hypothetical protein K4E_23410 [Enterococcus thailandicus]|nr:hypothetical protein K4E_23410 [Enterococcus thailandicus]
MTAILTIQNGKKVVNNGLNENKVLLEDINLSINEGDFITVLGGNGAGKSTLFNTIAGTLQLSQGSILFTFTHTHPPNQFTSLTAMVLVAL